MNLSGRKAPPKPTKPPKKKRKAIAKIGARRKREIPWEESVKLSSVGKRCPICGCKMEVPMIRHLVPRALAPQLITEIQNVRVTCAWHGQPEDADRIRTTPEKRIAAIRGLFGSEAAGYAEDVYWEIGLLKSAVLKKIEKNRDRGL